jgi:hypothetical protein
MILILMALDLLLAIILLDVERDAEPRRRLERVEARRRELQRRDYDCER